MDESQFIGLTKGQVYHLSEQLGLIPQLVRIDDRELLTYPEDTRDDRVYVEIDKGKVTKARIC